MTECRAAVVTGFNQPAEIWSVQTPELEPTGLLMRVDAATLCGTDVHCWHGRMPSDRLPYIPGHETTGTIVEMNGARTDLLGEPLNEATESSPLTPTAVTATIVRWLVTLPDAPTATPLGACAATRLPTCLVAAPNSTTCHQAATLFASHPKSRHPWPLQPPALSGRLCTASNASAPWPATRRSWCKDAAR